MDILYHDPRQDHKGRSTVIAMVAVAAISALLMVIGVILGSLPGFIGVTVDSAFVYPIGDAFGIATEQGVYLTTDNPVAGCYYLEAPIAGTEYGHAVRVWPFCGGLLP